MNEQQLRDRILQGEDENFELKSSLQPPTTVARYLSSFANTKGGTVLFGVMEPTKIVGVDVDLAEAIVARARALLSPSVPIEIQKFQLDGRSLVAVNVPKSESLVSAQGAYYWRTGDQVRPLTAAEIRGLVTANRSTESALTELSTAVATQTKTIEDLNEQFRKANSWSRKIVIAAVGAACGAILKHYLGAWLG